jgi:hypothetical protein
VVTVQTARRFRGRQGRQRRPAAAAACRPASDPELSAALQAQLDQLRKAPDAAKRLADLARELGLPARALRAVGYVGGDTPSGLWARRHWGWAAPMYDGAQQIVGLNWRRPDASGGGKRTQTGTHNGLYLPAGWRDRAGRDGVLYLVEGPSDVAAMTALDLAALGRPSNTGGVPSLVRLLKPCARLRLVVVGENDEKELRCVTTMRFRSGKATRTSACDAVRRGDAAAHRRNGRLA